MHQLTIHVSSADIPRYMSTLLHKKIASPFRAMLSRKVRTIWPPFTYKYEIVRDKYHCEDVWFLAAIETGTPTWYTTLLKKRTYRNPANWQGIPTFLLPYHEWGCFRVTWTPSNRDWVQTPLTYDSRIRQWARIRKEACCAVKLARRQLSHGVERSPLMSTSCQGTLRILQHTYSAPCLPSPFENKITWK